MPKKVQEEEKKIINIFESDLVPRQEILSGEEKAELLEKHNITLRQLPRVKDDDPVVKALGAKRGDVLRVTRKSSMGSDYHYFRVVL
jgi:DNA-directed RNA polymerase subunit H (RpoH/RPB5)